MVAEFGFFVWIWEEQRSRFNKESSVKRTGQLALRLVDSDSAQVCALPAFPPSSLSTWYGWLWFCFRIRIWKVTQQFVSSSFPALYSILLLACLPSYGFFLFFSEAVLCISLFSAQLSPSPSLSFSLSVACFLSGPRWTYFSSNSFRQRVISSLKDSTSSILSSQTFLRNISCISSMTSHSVIWFSDSIQL